MKKPDRITAVFGAIVLVCVVMVGAFSVSAAGGDKNDPLITLSYLTEVVTQDLKDMVEEQVEENERDLSERLDAAIDDYSAQMEQVLSQGTGESSTFMFVSLTAGQTLSPEAGAELLLRSGSASVSAGSSPVLLDATNGGNLEVGGALQTNHLYVAPMEGAAITAAANCVLMVRGTYGMY